MAALRDERLAAVVRILLGAIFLYAGVPKLLDPASFATSVEGYRMLPEGLVYTVAVLLPGIEVALGTALVLGVAGRGAALGAAVLMLVFLGGAGQAIARGIDIECGCFGRGDTVSFGTIARDLGFLAMAVYVVAFDRARLSAVSILRDVGVLRPADRPSASQT